MRAARTDANQPAIIAALRQAGAFVQPLHTVGGGVPDLLVAHRMKWVVMEVKDGAKPPSKQALTDDQVAWHTEAQRHAPVYVVNSVEAALAVLGMLDG